MAFASLRPRDFDDEYDDGHNSLLYGLFVLFVLACLMSVIMLYFRKRRAARQAVLLPTYQRRGHHRSLTITTTPTYTRQDKVYVFDEKMNLIGNSERPDSPLPEIRVTFPDEVDDDTGRKMSGRVVVVRISEQGSVGLEPLHQEQLPPYQQADSGRFQSLELDRLGGLREAQVGTERPRWS